MCPNVIKEVGVVFKILLDMKKKVRLKTFVFEVLSQSFRSRENFLDFSNFKIRKNYDD